MSRFTLALVFLAVSLIGFADSAYLTVKHYQGKVPPCSIIVGCEIVTTSAYSKILNIPVALLGAIYYAAVLLLIVGYFDFKKDSILKAVACLTSVGFLFSLWFLYVQFFILRAVCQYCLISAGTSITLFVFGMVALLKQRASPPAEIAPVETP